MPPDARPYWASKLLVVTRNSRTASTGTYTPMPSAKTEIFSTPSSRTSVPLARWPLMLNPTARVELGPF